MKPSSTFIPTGAISTFSTKNAGKNKLVITDSDGKFTTEGSVSVTALKSLFSDGSVPTTGSFEELTPNRVITTDNAGLLESSNITTTNLNSLAGVDFSILSSLNSKANSIDVYNRTNIDELLSPLVSTTYLTNNYYNITSINSTFANYYLKTEITNLLNNYYLKSETFTKAEVNSLLNTKRNITNSYNKTEVDNFLALKINASNTYNKSTLDTKFNSKANSDFSYSKSYIDTLISSYFTKTEIDGLFNTNLSSYYTKTETNNLFNTNLSSYYNKIEVDSFLALKINASNTYNKSTLDTKFNSKANSDYSYSKSYIDTLISSYFTKTETNNLFNTNLSSYYTKTQSDENFYLKSEVDTKISDLIGNSPESLNTLQELSNALNSDPNFHTTVFTALSQKNPLLSNRTGDGQTLMNSNILKRLYSSSNELIIATDNTTNNIKFTLDLSSYDTLISNLSSSLNSLQTTVNSKQNSIIRSSDENAIDIFTGSIMRQIKSISSDLTINVSDNVIEIDLIATDLSNIQNQIDTINNSLNNKQNKVTNVSSTEISYLNGVTSLIQQQLNGKQITLQKLSDSDVLNSYSLLGTNVIKNIQIYPYFYNEETENNIVYIDNSSAVNTLRFNFENLFSSLSQRAWNTETSTLRTRCDDLEAKSSFYDGFLKVNNFQVTSPYYFNKSATNLLEFRTDNSIKIYENLYVQGSVICDTLISQINSKQTRNADVSDLEFSYLNGVTSKIQSQLDSITNLTSINVDYPIQKNLNLNGTVSLKLADDFTAGGNTTDISGKQDRLDSGAFDINVGNDTISCEAFAADSSENKSSMTIRALSNPVTNPILCVRSSGGDSRMWIGQNLSSFGMNSVGICHPTGTANQGEENIINNYKYQFPVNGSAVFNSNLIVNGNVQASTYNGMVIPRIQSGSISVNTSGGNTIDEYTITFSQPFETIPIVIVGLEGNSNITGHGTILKIYVKLNSPTTTNFRAIIHDSDSSFGLKINYIGIGF